MLGMNPVKPIVLFLFLIFSAVLFAGTGLAKSESGAGTSQKWAVVSGFRSAQFGMNDRDILKAIRNDFGLEKKQELKKYKSHVELKLMREIKKTIDPNNIMNPGKVL